MLTPLAWLNQIPPSTRGAVLLVTGISVFGMSDNLTLLVSDDVGVGQFHFSRSLISIVMVIMLGRLFGMAVIPKNWKPVLARTLFIVVSMLLYFGVLPMMPIAEAGAGLFTSPIFVLLFSALFYGESIGWRRIAAVVIGSIGVLMVLQPGGDGFTVYNLLAVLAGASYAMGSIITFRYCQDESSLAILMSFLVAIGLCGALATTGLTGFPVPAEWLAQAPCLFKSWQGVGTTFWLWMVVIAAGASIALSLMTRAYQLTLTSYAAIYEYAYVISAGLFGWLFWGTVPGVMSAIGIMLIIGAGVIIVLAQRAQGD
ncbi:MAG: DMT family transporter [Alphaproteobacteria bacterium]|nr:DMT family transporter [Alphaproteobacteria bacterium]